MFTLLIGILLLTFSALTLVLSAHLWLESRRTLRRLAGQWSWDFSLDEASGQLCFDLYLYPLTPRDRTLLALLPYTRPSTAPTGQCFWAVSRNGDRAALISLHSFRPVKYRVDSKTAPSDPPRPYSETDTEVQ